MKLQPDRLDVLNVIHGYDEATVTVNGVAYAHSLVVPARAEVSRWDARVPADLTEAHFDRLLALGPELVLFGSGPTLHFLPPALHRGLIESGVGLETMDTRAACRTYNILAGEGRRVVAVLLIGG